MRYLFTIAALCLFFAARGQNITPEQAKSCVGKQVAVCGKVDGLHMNKINVYLDFGGADPNQKFEVVITGKVARRDAASKPYRDVWELRGKNICSTGKIELFKHKPYLVLSSMDLLKLQ